MKKQESFNKQLEAYKLYLTGMANDAIARQLHTSHDTIDRWAKAGDWLSDKNKLKAESRQKSYGSAEEERERTLKLIHGAESVLAKKIQDSSIKGDINSLASLERVKWDIIEPQRNKINLETDTFKFTITTEGSNGDSSKLALKSEAD